MMKEIMTSPRVRRGVLMAAVLLLCLMLLPASAEKAQEITADCIYSGIAEAKLARITDNDLETGYRFKANKGIEITYAGGISGVTVEYLTDPATKLCLQLKDADGKWQTCTTSSGFANEFLTVPEGTTSVRLIPVKRGATPSLAEIHVYGPGETPDEAPVWQLAEKADLMVIVAHPDDELLWFGGMLPTYAGERGYTVQVVYATSSAIRKLELLHGLWMCGVHTYPTFYNFKDKRMQTNDLQYELWGKNKFRRLVVESIRKYKPEVVATHDFHGEYGHTAHRITGLCVADCIQLTADANKYAPSAKQYGTWQVKKLYVHLWEENQITLDWSVPLEAFGGETSISVATRALACHVTQTLTKRSWSMERAAEYDNRLFGLYFTTVGPDEAGDDIMEHIFVESTEAADTAEATE